MTRTSATRPDPRLHGPGDPDRRALAAMASAASRARSYGDGSKSSWDEEETGERRLVSRSTRSGRPTSVVHDAPPASPPRPPSPPARAVAPRPVVAPRKQNDRRAQRRRERQRHDTRRVLVTLVAATAGVLVLAVAVLGIGLALRSPTNSETRATGAGTAHSLHHNDGSRASGTTPKPSPQKRPHSTTTSTTFAAAPTGGPRLSTVSPAAGSEGQTVVVKGTGLFSKNGLVVAYFGPNSAPTSCSSQTSCTVTVPDLGHRRATLRLTVLTQYGTSNPLTFSYT